jgi:hypothetical protein
MKSVSDVVIELNNAPDTYVGISNVDGRGLFTSRDFMEGEVIIDYGMFAEFWYEIPYSELTLEKIDKSRFVMIDKDRCITSDKISKFGYVNHSQNPNCYCDFERKKVISIKNIRKDEEIFINYCDEYLDKNVKIPEWI